MHLHATGTYCQNNESSCSQDSYSAPKSKGSSGLDTMWVGVGFCFNDRMLITRVVGWRPSFFLEVPFLWHGSVCWVMVLLFLRQSCKMRHVSWGTVARVFDLGFFDQCYCTSSVPLHAEQNKIRELTIRDPCRPTPQLKLQMLTKLLLISSNTFRHITCTTSRLWRQRSVVWWLELWGDRAHTLKETVTLGKSWHKTQCDNI